MTSMEREEKEKVKKREKKLEDEETLQQATWVKYTIPIKHQVNHLAQSALCSWMQLLSHILITSMKLPNGAPGGIASVV